MTTAAYLLTSPFSTRCSQDPKGTSVIDKVEFAALLVEIGSKDCYSQSPKAAIVPSNITWAQAASNAIKFTSADYLRLNIGGALLPWPYTAVILMVQIPVVIIRIVRWEATQYWCLLSIFFTGITYVQAYVSTDFGAAKVLVWTPLILVIDAGGMLQVFFLIIEARNESMKERAENCAHCSSLYSLSSEGLQES